MQVLARTQSVSSYLTSAEHMQKSDSEVQMNFCSKLELRNGHIKDSAKKDELATEEYVKVTFKIQKLDISSDHQ